jgi:acyl carrier protein
LIKNARIVSVGGPTETTLWNIWYPVEAVNPIWKSIPYGKPIANTQYFVLNQALEDCPTWVPGELCCTGVGIAKGYWHNEEKTYSSFITHPRTGDRLYRTGDLGRYLPDGNLEFLGRTDFQIKLRGFRIEPGEIESALMHHPVVRTAIVKAFGSAEQQNQERLVAYILPGQKQTSTDQLSDELRRYVSSKLPAYMVPSTFVVLEALPLSSNGKVDRKALLEPEYPVEAASQSTFTIQTGVARQIVEIVKSILKTDDLHFQANLLTLGATSVELVQITNQLEQTFQHRLKISELMFLSSVADIIAYYEKYLTSSNQEDDITFDEDFEEGEL